MALDLTLLTTKADCDEVLDSIAAELDTLQHHDDNLNYADRQAGRVTNDVTAQLAGVNAAIAMYTAALATPGITASMRKVNESKLRRANDRKDNLTERGQARAGSAAVLADIDVEKNTAKVAILTAAQAAVTTHKGTLPV